MKSFFSLLFFQKKNIYLCAQCVRVCVLLYINTYIHIILFRARIRLPLYFIHLLRLNNRALRSISLYTYVIHRFYTMCNIVHCVWMLLLLFFHTIIWVFSFSSWRFRRKNTSYFQIFVVFSHAVVCALFFIFSLSF